MASRYNDNGYKARRLRHHGWKLLSVAPNGHHDIVFWEHPEYGRCRMGEALKILSEVYQKNKSKLGLDVE